MSSIPTQVRHVDPFASYNSDTINKLTQMITRGTNGITTKTDLDVIQDSTSPTTVVDVTPGFIYKDDLLIELTTTTQVDFTDPDCYVLYGTGFDEDGWYSIVFEYNYIKSRPAPAARLKILKPSQIPHPSLGTSLLFLKAVYVTGGGPHYIDTSVSFVDIYPSDPTIKREYTDLYFGVETVLPTFNTETDQGRVVYETSTDAFWFGYSNRWGKISAGVEVTLNTDTTGVAVGSLCYTNSSGNAELAYAHTVDTGAEMVVVEVGLAINNSGRAIMSGFVEDVPVEPGIIVNVGDILYLSATEPGAVTNVRTNPVRQVVGRAITGGNYTVPIGILFFPRDVHSLAITGTINPADWASEGGGLYSETVDVTPLDVDSTHPTVIVNVWGDDDNKKLYAVDVEMTSGGAGVKIYTNDNSLTWNYIISAGGGSVGDVPGGGTNDHSLLLNVSPYGATGHEGVFAPTPHGNADHSATFIEAAGVTYENLLANLDIGTGATQVSQGDHTHPTLDDIPSGEIVLFESAVAVSGYSLLATVDDQLVYISSGGAAGTKPLSTWSQPNHGHPTGSHALSEAELPVHSHSYNRYNDVGGYIASTGSGWGTLTSVSTGSAGSGSSHNHGSTSGSATSSSWRPLGRNFTRQQRDVH